MDVQSNAGELVTCDIDNGVAVLTWNRPERRNSWSVPMEEEYFALRRQFTPPSAAGIMAEHGIAWMLPRIIGTGRAMDLLLSARVFLAEEALELGLVNQVVPREQVLDAAVAWEG